MTTMNITGFSLGPLGTNAYLLSKPELNKAIIIDPGMDPEPLIEAIGDLQIEAIVLTHAHFDHIGGVDQIRKLKQCPVYLHDAESEWLTNPQLNGSARWPQVTTPIVTAQAENTLEHGQELHLLGETFQVLHTPGHSPGSVSLVWNQVLFSGDVLFRESVGRTDLPGGNAQQLYVSIIDQLLLLPDDTQVLPGHGPITTIGHEKEYNPFI